VAGLLLAFETRTAGSVLLVHGRVGGEFAQLQFLHGGVRELALVRQLLVTQDLLVAAVQLGRPGSYFRGGRRARQLQLPALKCAFVFVTVRLLRRSPWVFGVRVAAGFQL
jgi:hypothetical protein